ncbi:hypothetical protein BDP27DRAFT_1334808 [Rhodocollybia butyracea]|uniref:Protein kinase domain-containing protein n=1 Tax=Rhodocollybia butyracea TaxID=206335 RepID=A0A9P5U2N6_9AGAR|nr:hypothetical protein BDP27DRAFT_1334808 [Rhodocollybia butyracea]
MRFPSITLSLFALAAVLPNIYAAPFQYADSAGLQRRAAPTFHIKGKAAVTAARLTPLAHGKSTVYRLASWDGQQNPGYVLKIYKKGTLRKVEIDGLERVKQLVAVDETLKAIVMHEAEGVTLKKLLEGHTTGGAELLKTWKPKIAAEAAHIAKTYGIYHIDLNKDNIIIDLKTGRITLVDWEHYILEGHPGFKDDAASIQKDLDVVLSTPSSPASSIGSKKSHKSHKSTDSTKKD